MCDEIYGVVRLYFNEYCGNCNSMHARVTSDGRILDPELGASQSGIRAWSYSTQERNKVREH